MRRVVRRERRVETVRKKQMPRYYSKNVARNAQRKFLRRKALEAAGKAGEPAAELVKKPE